MRHCKCSASLQTDTSSCFKEKPAASLLPSVALPSHLQPRSASFLTLPYNLAMKDLTSWHYLFNRKEVWDWREPIHTHTQQRQQNRLFLLIAGPFPCTCPSITSFPWYFRFFFYVPTALLDGVQSSLQPTPRLSAFPSLGLPPTLSLVRNILMFWKERPFALMNKWCQITQQDWKRILYRERKSGRWQGRGEEREEKHTRTMKRQQVSRLNFCNIKLNLQTETEPGFW